MSVSWISINKRLIEAVQLINSIPTDIFVQILNNVSTNKKEMFTTGELAKLQETLQLNLENVQLLIQSIIHILKQSSKIIIKPMTLQNKLIDELKFETEKAEEFVRVWTQTTKNEFGDLGTRKKLDKVSWELNLETHNSSCGANITPKARIQFGLSDFTGNKAESITLEFNEDELMHLYSTLENVQNKLDSIQNNVNYK